MNNTAQIFDSVKWGLLNENIDAISQHFAPYVYISVRNGESGFYSSHQAHFVLKYYFNSNRPVYFDFTSFGQSTDSHYATGHGSINLKGNRNLIQIYISLKKHNDRWVISQFNVY